MAMTLTELTRRLEFLERRIRHLEEAVRTIELLEIRAQRVDLREVAEFRGWRNL